MVLGKTGVNFAAGMSGDIAFDSKLNRTISVDAKYILFIIDKFAGATHLINEMTLVKSAPKTKIENVKKASSNKKIEKKSSESFGDAFLKAWRKGLKTFYWNGELYTTQRADDSVLIETE